MTEKLNAASIERRAEAVKAAMVDTGLVSAQMFDEIAEMAESWKPENGAQVVARAWTDPDFMDRLRIDATAACAELGYAGPQGEYIVALENNADLPQRDRLHSMLVHGMASPRTPTGLV